jgi:hypothetical protein
MYNAIAISHTLQLTTARKKTYQSALSSQTVAWERLRRQTFPLLWVPELSPCISYQLLTATAHNDCTAAVLWLTNSSLPCTALILLIILLVISSHGPRSKQCSSVAVPLLPYPATRCCGSVCLNGKERKEKAHVSNMFNFTMLVGIQYFLLQHNYTEK